MSELDFYQIHYYHYAKLGLADTFKRLMEKSRISSNIWEYERTGFITPFSPKFYTKQVVALRIYDFETKQPTDKWDVILKNSFGIRGPKANNLEFGVSKDFAEKKIEQFNQKIENHRDNEREKEISDERKRRHDQRIMEL